MVLTYWGRVTHICVRKIIIIGSDNGLSPVWHQAIIWINAGILLIGPLGTNFSEIHIEILTFPFKKMRLKVSSVKWWSFCLGLNVLNLSHSHSNTEPFPLLCRPSFEKPYILFELFTIFSWSYFTLYCSVHFFFYGFSMVIRYWPVLGNHSILSSNWSCLGQPGWPVKQTETTHISLPWCSIESGFILSYWMTISRIKSLSVSI